jgi:hypothetical protein
MFGPKIDTTNLHTHRQMHSKRGLERDVLADGISKVLDLTPCRCFHKRQNKGGCEPRDIATDPSAWPNTLESR